MTDPARRGRRLRPSVLAASAAIVLAALAFWHGCLDDFFAQDDFLFLEWTAALERGGGLPVSALLRPGPVDNTYRPLSTILFFPAMHAVFGQDAFPFHLASVILHLASCLLLYAAAASLWGDRTLALVGALFFLTRSAFYVTVYWVSCVQELLACLFGLLYVLAWIHHARKPSAWRLGGACLAYVLAAASKESALSLVACAPLLWFAATRGEARGSRRAGLASLLPLVAAGALYHGLHRHVVADHESMATLGAPALDRLPLFLSWLASGTYTQGPALRYGGVAAWLLLLLLPAAAARRSHDAKAARGAPLLFLAMFGIAALPMVLVRDRLAQYYGYLPGAFATLGVVAAVAIVAELSRRRRPVVHGLSWLLLLASAGLEYRTLLAKDRPEFLAAPTATADARGLPFATNVGRDWSGGWLNPTFRRKIANLHEGLRERWPHDPVPGGRVVLAGWYDFMVASNLRSAWPQRLRPVSTTEAMLRTFTGDPDLVVTDVLPDLSGLHPEHRRYYLTPAGVESYLASGGEALVVFSHPLDGTVIEVMTAGPDDREPVRRRLDAFFAR
jgi:hypothetical protein